MPVSGGSGSSASSTTPVTTIASSDAAQTLTAAASGDVLYRITLTAANCALTLAGGGAGKKCRIFVELAQDATAGRSWSLATPVAWIGGAAPVPNTLASRTVSSSPHRTAARPGRRR